MSEETIFDQNEVKEEMQGGEPMNNEETVLNERTNPSSKTPKGKKKKDYKTAGIAGAAGVAGAAIGVLTPVNVFPDALADGDGVSDDLEPEPAPSTSGHLQGHDMDVATGVDDSMSFSQAFAAARHEVGPGGLFVWHGNTYGTYYANEWNAMSPEDRDQYWADVHHTTSNLNEMEQETSDEEFVSDSDQLIDQELDDNQEGEGGLQQESVVSDDSLAEVDSVETHEDELLEEIELVEPLEEDFMEGVEPIDSVDDGQLEEVEEADFVDTLDVDVDEALLLEDVDENGLEDGLDEMLSPDEIESLDSDDGFVDETPDVDELASFEPDPNVTIDNNMNMTDFV